MQSLTARIKSFEPILKPKSKAKPAWPLSPSTHPNLTPQNLAEAGFYHCRSDDPEDDTVKCFLCGTSLGGWEPGDDPFEEHAKRGGCGWAEMVCGVQVERRLGKTTHEYLTLESLPSSSQSASVREQTFQKWWPHKGKNFKPNPKTLAAAGFVYYPDEVSDDQTTCPHCNYTLNGWEADDDPLELHQKKMPECRFFVAKIIETEAPSDLKKSKASSRSTKSQAAKSKRQTNATTASEIASQAGESQSQSQFDDGDTDMAESIAGESQAASQSSKRAGGERGKSTASSKASRSTRSRKKPEEPIEEEPPADEEVEEDAVIVIPEEEEVQSEVEKGMKAGKAKKATVKKPRATTKTRTKKVDEVIEEDVPVEGIADQDVTEPAGEEVVTAKPDPPKAKSSKSSKSSRTSKAVNTIQSPQLSEPPSTTSQSATTSSKSSKSKPAEKALPAVPPISSSQSSRSVPAKGSASSRSHAIKNLAALAASPPPIPSARTDEMSSLERFANIPPTSPPAEPTPKPTRKTLATIQTNNKASPKNLSREMLDRSVQRGASEARRVMDELINSPVVNHARTANSTADGKSEEEWLKSVITDGQKELTLEQFTRATMQAQHDIMEEKGNEMITAFVNRAAAERRRLETI